MKPKIGEPRRRVVMLALALSACVMQVLGSSLPSLVVCHRVDRPPRVEFFSDSCSCHLEEIHSCSDRNGHSIPGLGESCTDIHLQSHVLFTARVNWQRVSATTLRRVPGSKACAPGSVSANPRPAAAYGGPPRAGSPPLLSFAFSDSLLRC